MSGIDTHYCTLVTKRLYVNFGFTDSSATAPEFVAWLFHPPRSISARNGGYTNFLTRPVWRADSIGNVGYTASLVQWKKTLFVSELLKFFLRPCRKCIDS